MCSILILYGIVILLIIGPTLLVKLLPMPLNSIQKTSPVIFSEPCIADIFRAPKTMLSKNPTSLARYARFADQNLITLAKNFELCKTQRDYLKKSKILNFDRNLIASILARNLSWLSMRKIS